MMRSVFPTVLRQVTPEDEEYSERVRNLQWLEQQPFFRDPIKYEDGTVETPDAHAKRQAWYRQRIMGGGAAYETPEDIEAKTRARWKPPDVIRTEAEARRRTPGQEYDVYYHREAGRQAARPPGSRGAKTPKDPRSEAEQKERQRVWQELMKPDRYGRVPGHADRPWPKVHEEYKRRMEEYGTAMDLFEWPEPETAEPEPMAGDAGPQYELDTTKLPPEVRRAVEDSPGAQELLIKYYQVMKDLPPGTKLIFPRNQPPGAMDAETQLGGYGEPAPAQPEWPNILRALAGFRKMTQEPGADVEDMRQAFIEMYGVDPYELEIPEAP
jgi:hypothetical protein